MVARVFGADSGSIREARIFVLANLSGVSAQTRDKVELMVSELATNALLYAQTEFRVGVEVSRGVLRIEVTDAGAGMPRAASAPPHSEPHGRGLLIVAGLADSWGVVEGTAGHGKTVWFQLALAGGPAAASSPAAAERSGRTAAADRTPDVRDEPGAQAADLQVRRAPHGTEPGPDWQARSPRRGDLHPVH